MLNKNKVIWSVLVIIIVIVVAGIVTAIKNKPSDTIKIGAILSLTGNGSAYGQPAQRGMTLAIHDINSKGGINGKKLEAVYEDSQFDPKIALSAYQSLSARGIRFTVTNGSGVSLAVRKPVVNDHNFQFETAAVTPVFSDGQPNTCRLTLTAPVSGVSLGNFVSQNLKAKTFAALTLNDDYGKAMTDSVSQTVSGQGVVVKGADSFDKNATDFRTQITKLAALNPDVLLVVPAAGQAQAIFKQLKELGWKGAIVSDSWTIINDNLKDLSLVDGAYFVNYDWNGNVSQNDSESAKTFKSEYSTRFGGNAPVIAATTYDSVELLAKAITAVGTNDPVVVGQWLTNNVKDYHGVTGSVTLNQDCEASRAAVIQQVKGGSFVEVK